MKKILFAIALGVLCLLACRKKKDTVVPTDTTEETHISNDTGKKHTQRAITDSTTAKEDQKILKDLGQEINDISQSVPCTDASDWKTAPISPKPCGGYYSSIPYHSSIDEKDFLKKVEHYNKQQMHFNRKQGIMSDCGVVNPPSRVRCENNKAVVY